MKHWFIFATTLLLALLTGCANLAGGSHAEAEHEGMSAGRSLVEILDTPAPKTQDLRLINIRPGGNVTDSRIPREPGDALVIDIKPPIPAPEDLDYAPEAVKRVAHAGEHDDETMEHAEADHSDHSEESHMEGMEAAEAVDALPGGELSSSEDSLRAQVQELTAKAQELTERLERLSNQ